MAAKPKIVTAKNALSQIAAGLRTSATRPNIYGYKPHPKQETFHTSTAPTRLFLGGNRGGKTVAGAAECVWWALGKHPYRVVPKPPTQGRVVAVDLVQGVYKITLPEIARWMPPSALKNGSWADSYNKELRTLTLENGSTIEFMSAESDLEKFAGTSRTWTWIDEEILRDIFVECKMRLLDQAGRDGAGAIWLTLTPLEGMSSWLYDDLFIKSRTDPSIKVVVSDITENPHLNPVEIQSFMASLSDDERQARAHGKFIQLGGLIYKAFSAKNICEPFSPPKEWYHVAGGDFGFHNPTAWLWAAIDNDGRIFVYDEHYESGQTVQYHAQALHLKNQQHDRNPDYYVGDPSGRNSDPLTGTSVFLEYMDFGIPIIAGVNDVHAGINRVARMIEGIPGLDPAQPKLFIMRNCVNLIHEIQRYRWGRWSIRKFESERNKKEEPLKKDDHLCDALRYLVASRPQMELSSIPVSSIPVGANVGIDPEIPRYDREVLSDDNEGQFNSILGSEW